MNQAAESDCFDPSRRTSHHSVVGVDSGSGVGLEHRQTDCPTVGFVTAGWRLNQTDRHPSIECWWDLCCRTSLQIAAGVVVWSCWLCYRIDHQTAGVVKQEQRRKGRLTVVVVRDWLGYFH